MDWTQNKTKYGEKQKEWKRLMYPKNFLNLNNIPTFPNILSQCEM